MKTTLVSVVLAAALTSWAAAQAQTPVQAETAAAPIIFVHGNGDDATKWIPVIWMFESNGYPPNRLFAIRFTNPAARREDSKPEAFRSSTTDQASELSAFVTRVLLETKARKVVLIGSSRGGLTIRNYLKNAGGAAVVSHAILCGTPNHGVFSMGTNLDGEFNAQGHFLRQLNDGSELVAGVKFMTIRSDKLDKYAQPVVGYDAPELKGAENVVLPHLDHRELAFHPLAFVEMYRFLTGHAPEVRKPVVVAEPVISGLLTSVQGLAPTNCPLSGVHFRVFALKPGSAVRDGEALLDITTSDSGAWGPLPVKAETGYEFALEKDGRTVSYFMAGIVRSTTLLNFRFLPTSAAQALGGPPPGGPRLLIHRPQGYLSKGRDPVLVDGVEVNTLSPGVPTRDSANVAIPAGQASVLVNLRAETVYARPAEAENDLSIVELLWD